MLSLLQALLGVFIIAVVLYDVFQGVIVPRWTGRAWRLSPFVIQESWPLWKRLALGMRAEKRDDFLASFAPFMLVLLLAMWVGLLIIGYGLILFALIDQIKNETSFGDATYLAGVALLTIGFGDVVAVGALGRMTLLSAGASGLAVTALVISLTFTLYGAFSRREALILTLEARAGAPPSGVSLLETHAQFELLEDLPRLFDRWEMWSAEMLDSHLAYPLLPYFRSSHRGASWIGALGAVLDAATLLMTTVCSGEKCGQRPIGAAHLLYHMGCHTVDDLSVNLFSRHADYGAQAQDGTADAGIDQGEFIVARKRLQHAGFSLRDPNESWDAFSHHRAVYARRLNQLSRHFAAPPTQWIGDRSSVVYASHHDAHPKMLEFEEAQAEVAEEAAQAHCETAAQAAEDAGLPLTGV